MYASMNKSIREEAYSWTQLSIAHVYESFQVGVVSNIAQNHSSNP